MPSENLISAKKVKEGSCGRRITRFAALVIASDWHIDVSYINLSGTFYYLCSVLDGYSRSIVHWDLRESMKEAEIEMILEPGKEKYPKAEPRIISDNGPQFIPRKWDKDNRIAWEALSLSRIFDG